MGTALCIINIVAESKNILTEFISKLKSHLNTDPICFTFEIYRFMKRLCILIQITDKTNDSFRLVIFDIFRCLASSVLKMDGKFRIQISSLMKTALHISCPETSLLKDLRIGKEVDAGSCFFRLPQFRKKAFLQLNSRDSSLIVVMMYITVTADLNVQICGQSVYY